MAESKSEKRLTRLEEQAQRNSDLWGFWQPTPTKDGGTRGHPDDFVMGVLKEVYDQESLYKDEEGNLRQETILVIDVEARQHKGERLELPMPRQIKVPLRWVQLRNLYDELQPVVGDYLFIKWTGLKRRSHGFDMAVERAKPKATGDGGT